MRLIRELFGGVVFLLIEALAVGAAFVAMAIVMFVVVTAAADPPAPFQFGCCLNGDLDTTATTPQECAERGGLWLAYIITDNTIRWFYHGD